MLGAATPVRTDMYTDLNFAFSFRTDEGFLNITDCVHIYNYSNACVCLCGFVSVSSYVLCIFVRLFAVSPTRPTSIFAVRK